MTSSRWDDMVTWWHDDEWGGRLYARQSVLGYTGDHFTSHLTTTSSIISSPSPSSFITSSSSSHLHLIITFSPPHHHLLTFTFSSHHHLLISTSSPSHLLITSTSSGHMPQDASFDHERVTGTDRRTTSGAAPHGQML